MSLPEFDASRRKFLRYGTGVAAGLALSSSLGLGSRELAHFLETSYEYGPEVAHAVLVHPGQSLDAFRLWRGPEKTYEKSLLFTENLVYMRGAPNNLIGFGDSNLVGPDGTKWQESPIILYRDMAVAEKGFSNWNDFNCAKGGYTTDMIIEKQIDSQRAKDGFGMDVKCDVWINAGGNDVSNLVHSTQEVEELATLARDPFRDLDLLFKYTERIEGNIHAFEEKFLDLLQAVYGSYSPQIRQFVIMSVPDFGKATSLITQEFNGQSYIINIKNPAVRRLTGNIAVLMNNAMFGAVEKFQNATGSRIIGINTARPEISDFSSNQHFSEAACKKIAQTAVSRVNLVDS